MRIVAACVSIVSVAAVVIVLTVGFTKSSANSDAREFTDREVSVLKRFAELSSSRWKAGEINITDIVTYKIFPPEKGIPVMLSGFFAVKPDGTLPEIHLTKHNATIGLSNDGIPLSSFESYCSDYKDFDMKYVIISGISSGGKYIDDVFAIVEQPHDRDDDNPDDEIYCGKEE